jgi:3-deoxy-manno-octulosonate cytidylyltransferase (CMP-KDO synthetase)
VEAFGGRAVMTSADCASGADRVAEVARSLPDVEIVVNVQGDEPEIAGDAIDLVVRLLEERPEAVMSTLAAPIRSKQQLHDSACVKVVCDDAGQALYFSRSVIPHPREWDESLLLAEPAVFFQHIGLYAYRREFLLRFAALPPSRLEQVEKLEQLRVLQAGYSIVVGKVDGHTRGIDTADDYRAFVERLAAR